MAITLRDVARLAGVSASAVSRSYTEGAPVAAATRERVMAAARRLGYQPNRLAASLTTGRTRLIAVIADDLRNPFQCAAVEALTRGLEERGYRPLFVNLGAEADPEAAARALREYAVEAAIQCVQNLPQQAARAVARAGFPVVHALSRTGAGAGAVVAALANSQCGRLAARTLAERGYRRLAFIGGPEEAIPMRDRFNGFRNMAQRLDLDVRAVFAPEASHMAGRASARALMDSFAPDGIFCGDDLLALGALSELRASALGPDQVGLIGCNDIEMAGWPENGLTTLAQPLDQIVAAALDLAIHRANRLPLPAGEDLAENRSFAPVLIERGTLRAAP